MKEYISYLIHCDKAMTITDIYKKINENVIYQRNIFSFLDLKSDDLSKKNKEIYSDIGLSEYSYRAIPYNWLGRDDRPEHIFCNMTANIDSSWQQPNERNNESLSNNDFEKLITFCDDLKTSDVSSLMLVFDEINWDGVPSSKGICGIYPANSTYKGGYGYLSNCITISRTYESQKYTVILTCEKQLGDLAIIKKLLCEFGKIDKNLSFYAPEDEKEHAEWKEINRVYTDKLKMMTDIIGEMEFQSVNIESKSFQEQLRIEKEDKIDIKKYIKEYLCLEGWQMRKSKDGEVPIIVSKINGENEIAVGLVSILNGHQVSAILYVYHGIFTFSENIILPNIFLEESNFAIYFKDLQKILKCLETVFY